MRSIRLFGSAFEWGLTDAKHREICAELDDHLQCMAEAHGGVEPLTAEQRALGLAEAEAGRIAEPAVRRRLAGAHLADQVYATLHRKPTREEWRELMWLGIWFVLILASDVLAGWTYERILDSIDNARNSWSHDRYTPETGWAVALCFACWLLMALARAGFFASFAMSLYRAWQTGWGVCLGRVIQLKLIHTVLVVVALMGLGSLLDRFSWGGYYPFTLSTPLPLWLNAAVVCPLLAASGVLLWTLRRPAWSSALFMLITAFFLYPGGPCALVAFKSERPILSNVVVLSDGSRWVPGEIDRKIMQDMGLSQAGWAAPTQAEVERQVARNSDYYAKLEKQGILKPEMDITNNRMTTHSGGLKQLPFHISSWDIGTGGWAPKDVDPEWKHDPDGLAPSLVAPNFVPGGGVGWLAAPIPLLTFIGLCGLIGLLGRRGPVHMLLYVLLALLALGTTLMPFFSGMPANHLLEWGPMAIMHTPFPGFEFLMATPLTSNSLSGPGMTEFAWTGITLVLGLLLSAAIPWLMTGLFLKPGGSAKLPEDVEMA